MSMLEYNEIRERKYIVLDSEPYEVLSCHIFRKQQRKPVNQTKLRNLITGKVTERSFSAAEMVQEAEINKKKVKYLFKKENRQTEVLEYWFCDPTNPADRFPLPEDLLGDERRFMKENSIIDALLFDERIIGIKVPIKIDLKVTEAAPAVRGNTASNATKLVTLETGATVTVPIFIEEGEILRINTETGEYTERVQQ